MKELTIIKHGILLEKTEHSFENEGVLNPATIENKDGMHVFYRAVRKGNHSSIGYCKLAGPLTIHERKVIPVLEPEMDYESQGIEDPRLVKIDDLYYLTYTAYDGVNALGALATSTDLKTFERQGLIVPQVTYAEFVLLVEGIGGINEKYSRYNNNHGVSEALGKTIIVWDKDVILFPRKINDKFYFLHRIKPDIQIASVHNWDELNPGFWHEYLKNLDKNIALCPKLEHEISYIGGGCPPIETVEGWLIIYHAVHDTVNGFVYSACAALMDLNNPEIEISRLPKPLFQPDLDWELSGAVNNVCFPTGTLLEDDTLYIYYGAADEQIACASVSLSNLINHLLLNKISNDN